MNCAKVISHENDKKLLEEYITYGNMQREQTRVMK